MEAGFDFVTGQVTAGVTAAPLTTDAGIRCERVHISNLSSTTVYIGKVGVTTSTGYGVNNTLGELVIEYSGFVSEVYCVSAGTQMISWLAMK